MPFNLTDDPQFYGLKVSLNNTFVVGLFCSNSRMVIFSKAEKKIISKQTNKGHTFVGRGREVEVP